MIESRQIMEQGVVTESIYRNLITKLSGLYEFSAISCSILEEINILHDNKKNLHFPSFCSKEETGEFLWENFWYEIIEKAVSLFGIKYFALFSGTIDNCNLVMSWGFENNTVLARKKLNQNELNQFHFPFKIDKTEKILFMEQYDQIKREEYLIYHIFAQKVKDILLNLRIIEKLKKSEAQLHQSQKMEAIGRLSDGIAHDFNNILTAIKGYSDLALCEVNHNEQLRADIEEIKKAADRATSLTNQLLTFSRKQVVPAKLVNLNTIVADMYKMLRPIIGEDVEIFTILHPEAGSVKINPHQIEQVIINLAVNAKDAMPDGGRLTIETANINVDENYSEKHFNLKSGQYTMLIVSDTGCGMNAEVQSHIFEPFFTTKEEGKGTGLGLATVYGIVKQSNGNIYVYSELAKGTSFKIYFPKTDGIVETKDKEEKKLPSGGTETILVVEDEEDVRILIGKILQKNGYIVLVACNGEEAINICQKHKGEIHLMLVDVIMPQINGPALVKSLQKIHLETKVLYMSGYTDTTIVDRGMIHDEMPFIQKPFTANLLTHKIQEILNRTI